VWRSRSAAALTNLALPALAPLTDWPLRQVQGKNRRTFRRYPEERPEYQSIQLTEVLYQNFQNQKYQLQNLWQASLAVDAAVHALVFDHPLSQTILTTISWTSRWTNFEVKRQPDLKLWKIYSNKLDLTEKSEITLQFFTIWLKF